MAPPPPHIAVVAFPFSSHAAVLFSFARALAAAAPAGTSLSFLTTADNAAQLRKAGALPGNLRFVEVPDGVPPGETSCLSPPRRMDLFMAAAEAGGVRVGLEAACASAGGARVSCVVGDAFVWTADAASAAGAPWVAVWTAASCALLAHLRTDALRRDVGDQAASRADELLVAHAGLGGYRVRDLPDGVVSGDFNYVISLLVHRQAQRLPKAATAVALNTFPGLDPPDLIAALAAELPNCLPLGPYHLLPGAEPTADTNEAPADPHGCLAWLDRRPARSVAYVSFGTNATARPDELQELAAGLEASGAPFLWSLRGVVAAAPRGFLERAPGLVVPWAPQVGVLRHAAVGAFVTHAGWASVMEGVSSGVPMACRPFFGDQTMNARSVASVWGFGTAFDGPMTRGAVANAVATLLRGEDGERMRAKAQELQAMVGKAFEPDGGCRKNFDEFVEIVCRV
uniref:Anthocyanidin 3-O-glucosyltransferase n=1 Tax=Hordeum vulgare TaxID=4513 RepID=UFOG_HORVU|nr:RecName: Full=Anthocyanidin 3-O-glucosyltransferase; AltName: Full=Bronze-1; AltName: Full=Flavonol 3-O-glucosyltransferase; AltName: Full=UDP-glucose flavonoid 3-O-glucosyltransferase [Hordeum vulgare]CAA33729.1 UDPglucose flavonol 3,0 glucosyl transferase [Hordeum vulgare subsp. vulgare]